MVVIRCNQCGKESEKGLNDTPLPTNWYLLQRGRRFEPYTPSHYCSAECLANHIIGRINAAAFKPREEQAARKPGAA